MGLRTKLTIFKKIIDLKGTTWEKRKVHKVRKLINLEEEIIRTLKATKKTLIKWINEKKYGTTKRNWKGRNVEKNQIVRSLKIEKLNRKR